MMTKASTVPPPPAPIPESPHKPLHSSLSCNNKFDLITSSLLSLASKTSPDQTPLTNGPDPDEQSMGNGVQHTKKANSYTKNITK